MPHFVMITSHITEVFIEIVSWLYNKSDQHVNISTDKDFKQISLVTFHSCMFISIVPFMLALA